MNLYFVCELKASIARSQYCSSTSKQNNDAPPLSDFNVFIIKNKYCGVLLAIGGGGGGDGDGGVCIYILLLLLLLLFWFLYWNYFYFVSASYSQSIIIICNIMVIK